jgi:pimeloyl-ACP methyl ester carboxylesterase
VLQQRLKRAISSPLVTWLSRLALLLAACVLAHACSRAPQQTATDRLHPCTTDEGPTDAYCGTLRVFENRQTRQGRTIDLSIIVLPALSADARPDPVFFLAGGPGQGAARLARQVREAFSRIQDSRDIVLVDQRGTGESNPLDCDPQLDSLKVIGEPEQAGLDRLRRCLAGYDADVRLYTTSIAMDDLDDVRAFLGYETINVFGGSYGTRAALTYLRQHGGRVRTVVLDGVAPHDMRLPLFFARDAQRALDLLLADCAADARCRALHPNLDRRLRELLRRLDAQPARVTLVHPRTGIAEEVTVDGRFVASTIVGALYSPLSASLIPALVERAGRNDFQGMVALALVNETVVDNMSLGMQLSVLCAEDAPRVQDGDVARESAGTVFGSHLMALVRACEFWPRGAVDASFYEPVTSAVPTLIFSGELDPVTPPSWGEAAARTLSGARHVVVPGAGHGASGVGCAPRLLQEFLERGSAEGLDEGCLEGLARPPFFLTPAGPDPTAVRAAAP